MLQKTATQNVLAYSNANSRPMQYFLLLFMLLINCSSNVLNTQSVVM